MSIGGVRLLGGGGVKPVPGNWSLDWSGRDGRACRVGGRQDRVGSRQSDKKWFNLSCCKLITLYKRGVAGPAEYISSPTGGEGQPRSWVITVKPLLSALSNKLSPHSPQTNHVSDMPKGRGEPEALPEG